LGSPCCGTIYGSLCENGQSLDPGIRETMCACVHVCMCICVYVGEKSNPMCVSVIGHIQPSCGPSKRFAEGGVDHQYSVFYATKLRSSSTRLSNESSGMALIYEDYTQTHLYLHMLIYIWEGRGCMRGSVGK